MRCFGGSAAIALIATGTGGNVAQNLDGLGVSGASAGINTAAGDILTFTFAGTTSIQLDEVIFANLLNADAGAILFDGASAFSFDGDDDASDTFTSADFTTAAASSSIAFSATNNGYTIGEVTVTFGAVPEPATFGMLLLGTIGLFMWRRRAG